MKEWVVADLQLDPDEIESLGDQLKLIADEFKNADNRSDTAADAVGHGELADKIHDFAHNWNDKREKMLENLQSLADAAGAIGGSFKEIERKLCEALEE